MTQPSTQRDKTMGNGKSRGTSGLTQANRAFH